MSYKMPDKELFCEDCGNVFTIKYTTWYNCVKQHRPILCPECRSKRNYEFMRNMMATMSEEKKKARSDKFHNTVANRSEEKKQATSAAISQSNKNRWAKKSDEEKQITKSRISKSNKRAWANKSEEEKELYAEAKRQEWNSKSEEEKCSIKAKCAKTMALKSLEELQAIKAKRKETINAKSEYDKYLYRSRQSESQKRVWANRTEEERLAFGMRVSDGQRRAWDAKSDTEKQIARDKRSATIRSIRLSENEEKKKLHQDRISESLKLTWANKSEEEHKAHSKRLSQALSNRPLRAKIMSNQKRTKSLQNRKHGPLAQWFEHRFNEWSNGRYRFSSELENHSDRDSMNQDYTILDSNGNHVALVELDESDAHGGSFREHERAGRHRGFGSEQRDAERGLTIPPNIPFMIISEECADKSFKDLTSMLGKTNEEYIQWMYLALRSQPFPYPSYTDKQILSSYNRIRNRLKVNAKKHKMRLAMDHWDCLYGQHIMYRFYHSIWHDAIPGKMCPHDAYMNDEMLMDMIRKRYIIHVRNRNKITQCFLLSEDAPRVPIFTPIMGMKILHKYCQKYDAIMDCNTQYGGVLLATLAMDKKYIGYDNDLAHHNESLKLINWLNGKGISIDAQMVDKVPSGQCMCSYVPFGDNYVDELLQRTSCSQYILIVHDTNKYQDKIIDSYTTDDHWGEHEWYILKI